MKRIVFILLICSFAGPAWATTYYRHNAGSAANKAAASGPCTTMANCMSPVVYAAETFLDGDIIIFCHYPVGIPGKVVSRNFINSSRTFNIIRLLLENGTDKLLAEDGAYLISEQNGKE